MTCLYVCFSSHNRRKNIGKRTGFSKVLRELSQSLTQQIPWHVFIISKEKLISPLQDSGPLECWFNMVDVSQPHNITPPSPPPPPPSPPPSHSIPSAPPSPGLIYGPRSTGSRLCRQCYLTGLCLYIHTEITRSVWRTESSLQTSCPRTGKKRKRRKTTDR